MPFPFLAAASLGLGAARLFGIGQRRPNWTELTNYSNSLRPEGYLSAGDYEAGAGVRRRASGAVAEAGANLRMEALRRVRQRGIDLAPATEATMSRIGDTEAIGREKAAEAENEYLGNVRLGNQRFEQSKALTLLSGRIGDAGVQQARGDQRDSTFYNSLLDIIPSVTGGIDSFSSSTGTGYGGDSSGALMPRTYDPSTGTLRPSGPKPGEFD